jgi:GAF domain-containing protein
MLRIQLPLIDSARVYKLAVTFTTLAWTSGVLILVFLALGLRYTYRKSSRTVFWVLSAFATIALCIGLSIYKWPWRWSHVLAEVRPLVSVSLVGEGILMLIHFSSLVLVPLAIWMIRAYLDPASEAKKKRWKLVIELSLGLVVLPVVLVDSCLVAHLVHEAEAQEATKAIKEISDVANYLADDKCAKPARADSFAEYEVSPFATRDQAITKIVSQIRTMIRADFPELGPRAVSLHTIRADKILTVVQVGREVRRESLPLYASADSGSSKEPGSLIAAAIQWSKTMYCPDIHGNSNQGDCRYYDLPYGGELDYSQIACFPLISGNKNDKPFAGICVDGISGHPWDDRLDELRSEVVEQAASLVALLPRPPKDEHKKRALIHRTVRNKG